MRADTQGGAMAPRFSIRATTQMRKNKIALRVAKRWVKRMLLLDWVARHKLYMSCSDGRVMNYICSLLAPDQFLWGDAGRLNSVAKIKNNPCITLRGRGGQTTLEQFWGAPVVRAPPPSRRASIQLSIDMFVHI